MLNKIKPDNIGERIGMPLVDPVYTGIPLGDPSNTCRVHWTTIGKNLVKTASHWDATGETLTFAAYTGTPLGGAVTAHTPPTHIVKQGSIHASLKWQDDRTPISKWICLCKFSLYLEFTALQWIPVLRLTHASTSTSLCVCLWYEHLYSFCVFGGCKSNESVQLKQISPYQLYT